MRIWAGMQAKTGAELMAEHIQTLVATLEEHGVEVPPLPEALVKVEQELEGRLGELGYLGDESS